MPLLREVTDRDVFVDVALQILSVGRLLEGESCAEATRLGLDDGRSLTTVRQVVRDAKAALVDAADATLSDHAMNRRELIASVAEVAREEEEQLRRMIAAEPPRQLNAATAVATSTSAAAALRGRWARRHSDWGSCRTMSLPPPSTHEQTLAALARDAESIAALAPVRALAICPDAAPSRVSPYGGAAAAVPSAAPGDHADDAPSETDEDDAPSAAPDDDAVDAPSKTDDRRLHELRRALEDDAPSAAPGDDVDDAPSETDYRWLHEPRRALEDDVPPSAAPGDDVDDVPLETDDRGLLEPRRALEKEHGLATEDDRPPRVQSCDKEASSPNSIVEVALDDDATARFLAAQPSTSALDEVRCLLATAAEQRSGHSSRSSSRSVSTRSTSTTSISSISISSVSSSSSSISSSSSSTDIVGVLCETMMAAKPVADEHLSLRELEATRAELRAAMDDAELLGVDDAKALDNSRRMLQKIEVFTTRAKSRSGLAMTSSSDEDDGRSLAGSLALVAEEGPAHASGDSFDRLDGGATDAAADAELDASRGRRRRRGGRRGSGKIGDDASRAEAAAAAVGP